MSEKLSNEEFMAKMKEHEQAMQEQMAQENDRNYFNPYTCCLTILQPIFYRYFQKINHNLADNQGEVLPIFAKEAKLEYQGDNEGLPFVSSTSWDGNLTI